jgi:hypothetical protein
MKKIVLIITIVLTPLILLAQAKSSVSGLIGLEYSNRILKNPAFSGESGLRFASIGYNGEKKTGLTYGSEFNPTTGVYTPDPTLPHQIQLIYDYLFLEIPIGIRRELKQNKMKTYIAVGLSPNVYLKTKIKTITEFGSENKAGDPYGIQKVTFSANIGFGFEYTINEQCQAFAQPSFRYHFTSIGKGPIKEYLYNFGLEVGVRKNLN